MIVAGETICFDIAAVILCLALIAALLLRRLTKGKTNRMFICLVSMLTGILDVWANLYGIVLEPTSYSLGIQYVLSLMYLMVRNFTTVYFILYIISVMEIWHSVKKSKLFMAGLLIPYLIDLIILIVNKWNGLVFSFNEKNIYERGPLINVLYVVAIYYMIFALVLLIVNAKIIGWRKVIILCAFLIATLVAVGIQFVFSSIRLEIFATSITAVLVAIGVQRPEENTDILLNSLNYNGFLSEMDKNFHAGRPMSAVCLKIVNHKAIRNNVGLENYSVFLRHLSDMINKTAKIMSLYVESYYLERGTFAMISDHEDYELMRDYGRLLNAYLQDTVNVAGLEIEPSAKIVLARIPDDIDTKDVFVNFVHSFSYSLPDSNKLLVLSAYSQSKEFRVKTLIDSIITNAIKKNKLQMYYQPIYSVRDKKFVSAEALIRLIDDEYGFISPGLFIPAAEESGAIHMIGDFVLNDVCRFISRNNLEELGVHYIEINLSVAQCVEPGLVRKIIDTMMDYQILPDKLNLEITETAVDYEQEITMQNINGLSNNGFSFSLDDYGTGYSNIKRLASLPLDIVKLDKSFVDEIEDPKMWTVIEKTVNMLKKINKKILVEGVEDENALNKFIELGCDYIQGFYFSKPLPGDEYLRFVRNANKKAE